MKPPVNDRIMPASDTIVARATPAGRGGIGIIRISGPRAYEFAETLLKQSLTPRQANYRRFYDADASIIDEGIALYFPTPNSFTGEDVVELQGHGGPVILDLLLQRLTALGARAARPGEFSERAFLNGKLDLTQAEAIADLIDASSQQAARSAMRSLQGEFSTQIQTLLTELIHLRCYVEAAIDFPEEEIDFLSDGRIDTQIKQLLAHLTTIFLQAKQGTLLSEGIHLAIVGPPNAGKSSLLNYFTGESTAIVTDIAGTTRDIIKSTINLDGFPIHLVDTAGLRDTHDPIEQEGIKRTTEQVHKADLLLLMLSADLSLEHARALQTQFADLTIPKIIFINKTDLCQQLSTPLTPEQLHTPLSTYIVLTGSIKSLQGLTQLKTQIKQSLLPLGESHENTFTARRRHLVALTETQAAIERGQHQLLHYRAGELLAEELRLAQLALSSITGEYHSDDLLGEIFSNFCIGK